MNNVGNKLYKYHGVLWRTVVVEDDEFIADDPLCPKSDCHMILQNLSAGYYCAKCDNTYTRNKEHSTIVREARDLWEGYQTLNHEVYSLDLPPTKVLDEDKEDEHYWVQARISEKDGKRMAVVYFGERVSGKQDKKDYSQIFLDFEDEQLRFDKTNKNPMKLLSKLTAEFTDSSVAFKKKK